MGKKAETIITPRFCPSCHRIIRDDKATECPHCHGLLSEEIPSIEELSHYSREAHNHDIDGFNRKENALCFVVIGAIVFIIGVLFIFLSFQKKANIIQGINPASFSFVICVIGLSVGTVLLSIGIVRLVRALKKRKRAMEDIAYIESLRQKQ